MVLSSSRNQVGYMTFPQTMIYAFEEGPHLVRCLSKASGHFVDIVLGLSHYGVCVVYLVFVAVNMKQFLDYYGLKWDLRLIIAVTGLCLWPFFMLRELKYLVPSNIVATFLYFIGVLSIVWYFFDGLGPISDRDLFPPRAEDIPLMLGITLYGVSSVGGVGMQVTR